MFPFFVAAFAPTRSSVGMVACTLPFHSLCLPSTHCRSAGTLHHLPCLPACMLPQCNLGVSHCQSTVAAALPLGVHCATALLLRPQARQQECSPAACWWMGGCRGGSALVAWLAVVKLCLQETMDKTHYRQASSGGLQQRVRTAGKEAATATTAAKSDHVRIECAHLGREGGAEWWGKRSLTNISPSTPDELSCCCCCCSVDMFLAVVVTSLVWHWRSGLYPPTEVWRERPPGIPADRVPYALVALVAGVLLLVFVGVAGT